MLTSHERHLTPVVAWTVDRSRSRFLQGPDTDRRAVKEIRRAIDTASECTVRLLNYTKNGQPFWCEAT